MFGLCERRLFYMRNQDADYHKQDAEKCSEKANCTVAAVYDRRFFVDFRKDRRS